jgi:hypothetical protein
VHLKTHGEFSSDTEETYLVAYKQLLKGQDIANLIETQTAEQSNNIELLVLSACQTASGDNRAVLGLAGIAVRAGGSEHFVNFLGSVGCTEYGTDVKVLRGTVKSGKNEGKSAAYGTSFGFPMKMHSTRSNRGGAPMANYFKVVVKQTQPDREEFMFRIDKPSDNDIAFFHENGYIAFPAVLTEEGRQGLMDEILRTNGVVEFLQMTNEERGRGSKPHRLSIAPWNDKGPYAEQLFDAPLVTALLRAVIGETSHFCSSTVRISMRGSKGLVFHHDNRSVNLDEQHRWYIQMLYYPNGFEKGDASLWVIPGSHRISDWGEYAPFGPPDDDITPELLTELYGEQIGRVLVAEELALPPGSMVFMNARMFHAVSPKPIDSPQEMRLVANYLFKEPGSPRPYTQVIPPEWIDRAGLERRKLFQRKACQDTPPDVMSVDYSAMTISDRNTKRDVT